MTRKLVDSHGRVIRKLRVSLTDACNYACLYCMPAGASFSPRPSLLTPKEYGNLCRALIEAGLEEIRLTGGEPTVRPEFRAIVEALQNIPVKRRGITSNGHLLGRHLGFLKDQGWMNLNISLDSLDAGKFERLTGGGDFRVVMDCIEKAMVMGFRLKINVVMMRGLNDDELIDFAEWSAVTGIEVRFLEHMPIGAGIPQHAQRFLPADEMLARLQTQFDLRRVPGPLDSTAMRFRSVGGVAIGMIASESKPFCAHCSRLRLSATGWLRGCVMEAGGVPIRNAEPDQLPNLITAAMRMKPLRHGALNETPMHALGG